MGIADVIPGISGGSIAFISGIYEELIGSIYSIDKTAGKLLIQFEFKSFWRKINGNFLLTITAGMLTSLILLSVLMQYLLKNHAIMVWSFLFGLIVMAVPLMLRKVQTWNVQTITSLLVGTGIMYLLTIVHPLQAPHNLFFIFISGVLSVCGLVIPGISGVSILMLFGQYQTIVTALNDTNTFVLVVFFFGCIVGVLSASRVIAWAWSYHQQITIALLTGFMIGALNKVWPWRKVLEYATNVKGDQIAVFDKSVLPWHFLSITEKDPQLFQAILMMALGVLVVVTIEKIAVRLKTKH